MPTTTTPDDDTSDFVDGVDRHFYENQVGAANPFDDTHAFRLAAARAKDRARHKLIRAIQMENQRLLTDRGRFTEAVDILGGDGTSTGDRTAEATINVTRSIDGVEGAKDDAIKL